MQRLLVVTRPPPALGTIRGGEDRELSSLMRGGGGMQPARQSASPDALRSVQLHATQCNALQKRSSESPASEKSRNAKVAGRGQQTQQAEGALTSRGSQRASPSTSNDGVRGAADDGMTAVTGWLYRCRGVRRVFERKRCLLCRYLAAEATGSVSSGDAAIGHSSLKRAAAQVLDSGQSEATPCRFTGMESQEGRQRVVRSVATARRDPRSRRSAVSCRTRRTVRW